ncbi:MAG: TetR/AcrR family transcriptional regulator [Sphingobium sp.]
MSGTETGSTEQKQRRKRRSTEAITDLVIRAANQEFGRHGYVGATTAAIAREADVTEAQLFRLFGSKEALFKAAIFQPLNEHFSRFLSDEMVAVGKTGSVRTSSHHYIDALQDFMEDNARVLMSMVVASAYSQDSRQQVSEMEGLRAYFDRGAELMARRVGKDAKVDPQLMVRVSFAAVLASVMFRNWLFPEGTTDADIRHAVAAFVTDGIPGDEGAA